MRRYVCGFLCDRYGDVVLLRKETPAWQRGKLNGVGGKVEPGEDLAAAMRREWLEEAGVDVDCEWRFFAVQSGPGYECHFACATVDTLPALPPRNDVGEAFAIANVASIPDHVISNLRWLLPLAFKEQFPIFVMAREQEARWAERAIPACAGTGREDDQEAGRPKADRDDKRDARSPDEAPAQSGDPHSARPGTGRGERHAGYDPMREPGKI